MLYTLLLIVTAGVPMLAALLSLIGPKRMPELWSYPASLISLIGSLWLLGHVYSGGQAEAQLLTVLPGTPGVGLAFRADALGVVFAVLASGLWVLASVYSNGYARATGLKHRPRFFACFAASVGAAIAIAFAGNLLTFLLFYELLTLMTYPLVIHKQTPAAMAGGRRYLVFTLTGGMILTAATAWTWWATGTLDFAPGGFVADHFGPTALSLLFLLFIIGCGVKAAIMPLHSWLPAAMVAPTPVSALLHAVAVVKAGVFGCIRVVGYVFGADALNGTVVAQSLAALCAATIVFGSLLALREDHLKRRLAYSTIVHLSYIVLGAALLTPLAMIGAILHMVNHGLAKITLFFCAGSIHAATHGEYISHMKGLGRRMPFTFAAFTVASLGLIGVPGLCGFISKMFLIRGAWQASELLYLGVLTLSSLFTAMYLLPIVRTAYLETPAPEAEADDHRHPTPRHDAGPALLVPLLTTAAMVIVFGLVPAVINLQYDLAGRVTTQVFGGAP